MKKYLSIIPFLALLLTACDEKEIVIPEVVPDSDRKVVIEEFTGVECVNCPQGSAELENLLGLYGENLIAVSIHAGIFSDPYPESKYDFRTEEGTNIQEFVGNPLGWPSAVVNRYNATGGRLQQPLNRWAGAIDEALSRDPLASVAGDLVFDRQTRTGNVSLRTVALAPINEPLYITVLISESHIKDAQLTPTGLVLDYDHKHVLRKVLTSYSGQRIAEGLGIGEVVQKNFSFAFDPSWVVDNCKIIAFVHYNENSKEILQAEEFTIPN